MLETAATVVGIAPAGGVDLPSLLANRYEILGLVGAGGMGRVYRAHDRVLDEIVALKLLRRELAATADALARFRNEVKLARRVTNAHVVRTFDLGQHDDDWFLTMEYVEGRALAQLLDDGIPPLAETLRIVRAATAGMAAAHAAGVLHRDLKPDNILVGTTGRVAVTDFGIASGAGAADGFVGTPAYMSPEQVEAGEIGPPADVYALGAILYELLVGKRPFTGANGFELAYARLLQEPPDPREHAIVPDVLAELVLRCLARDPAARPGDASALGDALAALGELAAPVAAPAVMPVPTRTALALALLPLRADADLADVAAGLSEEIVDALSATRLLRVRPLAAVRTLAGTGDPRELGKVLDVDVVVTGSLQRSDGGVAIVARAIGTADGFQLWAQRFDVRAEQLLSAGHELARAIAQALAVELEAPMRSDADARAIELYLEGKAKLRVGWATAELDGAIADLERAYALVPEDPRVLAALAQALARHAFYGHGDQLPRACVLAQHAVDRAPAAGESWLALGVAQLYRDAQPEAAAALATAVARAPGLQLAHALLGGLAAEAGDLDAAILHLEAAVALDPDGSFAIWDLSRVYVYAGRAADSARLLERAHGTELLHAFNALQRARFAAWRGERSESLPFPPTGPIGFNEIAEQMRAAYATGRVDPDDPVWEAIPHTTSQRRRATWSQFAAECMAVAGEYERTLAFVEQSVDAGLRDRAWIERCPLLAPLRDRPAFVAVASRVRAAADAVRRAIHG